MQNHVRRRQVVCDAGMAWATSVPRRAAIIASVTVVLTAADQHAGHDRQQCNGVFHRVPLADARFQQA